MVVESGLSRGQGFAAFAHQSPRSGTMISSARSAEPAPGVPRPPRGRRRGDGGGVQSARGSSARKRAPDSQLAREAREAILELRTSLRALKKQEERSWRRKSQLMRERHFEESAKHKLWTTSDVSAALGEEALALGAEVCAHRTVPSPSHFLEKS